MNDIFFLNGSSENDKDLRILLFSFTLWSIHLSFLSLLNNQTTVPILSQFTTLIQNNFQNFVFGKTWSRKVKKMMSKWPVLWFLEINKKNKTVKFSPKPLPHQTIEPNQPVVPPDPNSVILVEEER